MAGVSDCIYCGDRFPIGDEREHDAICPEHPLRAAEARIERLEALVRDLVADSVTACNCNEYWKAEGCPLCRAKSEMEGGGK